VATENHALEEEILRDLAGLESELEAARAERDELDRKITRLAEAVRAYELVLEHRRGSDGGGTVVSGWERILAGLTHKERVVEIAKRNGGQARKTDVTDILYSQGFMRAKSRANAYTAVQEIFAELVKDGVLVRTGTPGTYRLKEEAPTER